MSTQERDTSRVSVKTYVPAYQRAEWDDHADELDMSRSEFVRSMVQAGRRGFDPGGSGPQTTEDGDTPTAKSDESDTVDRTEQRGTESDTLDGRVLELLEDSCLSWDELVAELTDDLEDRLEETIQRLQTANEIHHDGRAGGYVRDT